MAGDVTPVPAVPPTAQAGAYFDDLRLGQVFDSAPSVTLDAGTAAVHRSILGDRLRLSLDAELAAAVTGSTTAVAHPGLVCDVAIGQSTLATQRVKANLFYRGLAFHRYPCIGDTIATRTEVVKLRRNTLRPGRPPTGLAVLRMSTVDHLGRQVLDFHRCAMLPASGPGDVAESNDDLSDVGAEVNTSSNPTAGWNGAEFRRRVQGDRANIDRAGTVLRSTADVVTGAPELARLTLNIAQVHHDWRASGQRLVYGGHTIGLALAQASRLLPNLVTVLSWRSCDHTAPVYEGDTLYSDLTIERATELPERRGNVLHLRSVVWAVNTEQVAGADRRVLDWRFDALHF